MAFSLHKLAAVDLPSGMEMGKASSMNKIAVLLLTAVLVFFGADPAKAATKLLTDPSNRHNLSSNATGGRIKADLPAAGGTDEICVFCHTPHGASAQSVLWNRKDPANMGSFALYGGPIGTPGGELVIKGDYPGSPADALTHSQYGVDYPNGSSRMCLSCHDGNTAQIGEVLNPPNVSGGSVIEMLAGTFDPNASINDLSVVHPISFIYDSQVVADIEDINAKGTGTYKLPSVSYVRLDDQERMQCTTCHDPHDDNKGNTSIGLPFWRHTTAVDASAAYDDVCNACHESAPGYNGGHGTKNLP
jgi:hypothetical protein